MEYIRYCLLLLLKLYHFGLVCARSFVYLMYTLSLFHFSRFPLDLAISYTRLLHLARRIVVSGLLLRAILDL